MNQRMHDKAMFRAALTKPWNNLTPEERVWLIRELNSYMHERADDSMIIWPMYWQWPEDMQDSLCEPTFEAVTMFGEEWLVAKNGGGGCRMPAQRLPDILVLRRDQLFYCPDQKEAGKRHLDF